MKAYNLHNVNDLRYEDVEKSYFPSSEWVIVKVKAAGICSSDIARVFKKGTYHFPTIPGHEFAGIVDSVADEKYIHLIGKHVGVFPLIPCRECEQCKKKHYEMCANYDYIGSRRDGGFAEYVAIPIWNLVELPENIEFRHAAMLEPLAVGLHAMKRGGVKEGDKVAVVGTGMIGICGAQWAKMYGAASIDVIGRNECKRQMIEKCGVNYIVNDGLGQLNEYDFVLEAVGTPQSIATAINITAPGKTLLLMGNPNGDINLKQNDYWRILRKQLILKGSWNSSYDGTNISDWTEAVNALANHEIEVEGLISHIFEKDQLMQGLILMYNHQEPYCKVMTIW